MSEVGRLHLITDVTLQDRFSHLELAAIAARSGVDVVQFRHKPAAEFKWRVDVARGMQQLLHESGSRLVINDHPNVAAAVEAEAVHLGLDDPSPAAARELLGRDAFVGLTVNNLAQALASGQHELDYVGVGPVFGTASKAAPAPTLGLDGLREIVDLLTVPVVAIGNIQVEHVGQLFDCGVAGVAVLSAICCAADPACEISRFHEAIAATRVVGEDA
jgi:thiamine-phosphate pyrophosphorylase